MGPDMDQLEFLLVLLLGFILGFGLRAIISQYRRHEARKEREARKARLVAYEARKEREARHEQPAAEVEGGRLTRKSPHFPTDLFPP
jgi:hypothetical protein